MTNKKANDEISKLLDSFQEEDILEEKMEDFSAQKKRRSHKHAQDDISIPFQDTEDDAVNSTEETVILRPEQTSNAQAGETVMFDPEQIEQEDTDTNKTVVINDNEIQSLLDEDKPPKLRREVTSKHRSASKKTSHKMPAKKSGPNKAIIVVIVLVSLLVVGMIGFGVYSLATGNNENTEEPTSKQKKVYNRILDWLDGLDDEDYSDITDYEDDYNSLTDKQKKDLNDYFEKLTGYTFDELLAKAKSDDKKDSSNNNAKVAELRAQLTSLQSQLEDAQSELNDAKSTLSQHQSEYDTWNTRLTSYQETNSQLQQKQTELNTLEARMRELQNIPADQITNEELTELRDSYNKQASLQQEISNLQGKLSGIGDYNTIQSQVNSASSAVSQAQSAVDTAQSTVDSLNSQIQDIQNQIKELQ